MSKANSLSDLTHSLQRVLQKAGCKLEADGVYGVQTAEAALNALIVLRKINEEAQKKLSDALSELAEARRKLDAAGLVEGPVQPLPVTEAFNLNPS